MEIFRALGVLIEPPESTPGPPAVPNADAENRLEIARLLDLVPDTADGPAPLPTGDVYTELFLFQLYPYASVYLGAEGMMGGDARDRVAGFFRALGMEPPKEPDHLAFLLAAHADLATTPDDEGEAEDDPKRLRARKALLWEHLLSWLPGWLHALRRLDPPPFYRRWADLLDESLRREAALLGPPDELPLHLRRTPALADPDEEGAEAFVQGLLAPARSGLILLRSDLRRAARELGLGLRAGERRYVVEHLLGQDAEGFLAWLAAEAESWATFWAEQEELGPVSPWWAERAASTARILSASASASASSSA